MAKKLTWAKKREYIVGVEGKKIAMLLDQDIDMSWDVYDQRATVTKGIPHRKVGRDIDSKEEAMAFAEKWVAEQPAPASEEECAPDTNK